MAAGLRDRGRRDRHPRAIRMRVSRRAERGISLYREHPTPPVFWPTLLTLRATALASAGRFPDALAVLDEAAEIVKPGSADASLVQLGRGDVLGSLADLAGAEAAYRASIEIGAANGARALQLTAATHWARLSPHGRRNALPTLQEVLATMTEGFDSPLVQSARAFLEPELTRADT